jgi:hypothetical protein
MFPWQISSIANQTHQRFAELDLKMPIPILNSDPHLNSIRLALFSSIKDPPISRPEALAIFCHLPRLEWELHYECQHQTR